ncbi:MAG: transglycosylase SLT domain-containing protein [Rhodospirillales bacterium]|nr:transglycosylase SLT domain-containing protein [Rhodospirillales bacterium]
MRRPFSPSTLLGAALLLMLAAAAHAAPKPTGAMPASAGPLSPAMPDPADSALCDTAIASAEWAARLPPRLLGAIALVETGRPDPLTGRLRPWPWTINAQGQGYFYPDKAAAVAAARDFQAQGIASIDVGCLQINLAYHPDAFKSLDQAFDPGANARFAARFLDALHTATGHWMAAIAAYHSETPDIGADYRDRVMALWQAPDPDGASGAYRAFAPAETQFGAFGGGHAYGAFARPDSQFGAFAPAPAPASSEPAAPRLQ